MKHLVETGRNGDGWWFWRCSCGDYTVGYAHEVDARMHGAAHGVLLGRVS